MNNQKRKRAVAIISIATCVLFISPLAWTAYWASQLLSAIDRPTVSYDLIEIDGCRSELKRFGSMKLVIPYIVARCRDEHPYVRKQALLVLEDEIALQSEAIAALRLISLEQGLPAYVRQDVDDAIVHIETINR